MLGDLDPWHPRENRNICKLFIRLVMNLQAPASALKGFGVAAFSGNLFMGKELYKKIWNLETLNSETLSLY
jgi:hypothetical protein